MVWCRDSLLVPLIFLEVFPFSFFPPVPPVPLRGLSPVLPRLVATDYGSLVSATSAPPTILVVLRFCDVHISAVDTGALGLQDSRGTRTSGLPWA